MYLTLNQAAELLKVSKARVRDLATRGLLPHLPLRDDGARKYYKFIESGVRAYKRSLRAPVPNGTAPVATPRAAADDAPEGYVSLVTAAERLHLSPTTLVSILKRKGEGRSRTKLESVKTGHRRFVLVSSLDLEVAARNRRKAKGEPVEAKGKSVVEVETTVFPPMTPPAFIGRITQLEVRLDRLEQVIRDLVESLGGL